MNINPYFCGSVNYCNKMTQWSNNIKKKQLCAILTIEYANFLKL